ncbi:MAG: transcription termination/antitermination NusG family protein [Ilumatobacteraceae bacterium]
MVRCQMDDDSWYCIRNTPGVTGFVGQSKHGRSPRRCRRGADVPGRQGRRHGRHAQPQAQAGLRGGRERPH